MHVVCQWIGNSQPIAAKHYLQVTDDHFSKAVRNPVQQPAVLPRTGSQAELAAQEKTPVLQGSAAECDVVRVAGVPPQGLEPGDVTPSVPGDLRQTPNQRAAECAAVGDDLPPIDPNLASVIEAWHSLPPAIHAAILAMIDATETTAADWSS
jgi:hypothetical protein